MMLSVKSRDHRNETRERAIHHAPPLASKAACNIHAAAIASTAPARCRRVASASSINSRLTAALDIRSSNIATPNPVISDKSPAQSRALCAAGPTVPSIDNGNPTTRPPTSSFNAIFKISIAIAFIFPRFKIPNGEASINPTSVNASPIVLLPGSIPISRRLAGNDARNNSTEEKTVMTHPNHTKPRYARHRPTNANSAAWQRMEIRPIIRPCAAHH